MTKESAEGLSYEAAVLLSAVRLTLGRIAALPFEPDKGQVRDLWTEIKAVGLLIKRAHDPRRSCCYERTQARQLERALLELREAVAAMPCLPEEAN